ncbi:DUF262 domain-containing protein [Alicyclobacillus suci]|uniref:DUF262 domain-containing protein n=1 Tax=Alicyclobacillus suci TaxID=2816080 RepID=UPI001A8E1D38|nr:DUF262 domain-containing protein [Alicyclobacillus suci]
MKMSGSDPDMQTIIARIVSGDLNLQPDFQRGEVWGDGKKRRLIDSILREWHVPPIHVVQVKETAELEVLDGQQRLAAIRDFYMGRISVDGFIGPDDSEIRQLHGCTYHTLPQKWQRKFNQFTIRMFQITNYEPDEPGELFYRLNQPTNLTSAEQRNAFFGPAREQVKELAKRFEGNGLGRNIIGFSNSRMAYDDVIAKLCLTLDMGTLYEKITSAMITNKFRSKEMFSDETISRVERTIDLFAAELISGSPLKFNKATMYSWLLFVARFQPGQDPNIGKFIREFERLRVQYKTSPLDYIPIGSSTAEALISVFNDRASSRVNDVTSVVARDLVLWVFYGNFSDTLYHLSSELQSNITEITHGLMALPIHVDIDRAMYEIALQYGWGSTL